jgi:hypothetical protein
MGPDAMSNITRHSLERCAQRNVDPGSLAFIKRYGQKLHRTGIVFYFLGRRDIPEHQRIDDRYAKLEGATVLEALDGGTITVYRNRNGLKNIKKKRKYRLPLGQMATIG